MSGFRSITPSINVNTESGQLRTELLNTFNRLDGQLINAPYQAFKTNGPVLTSGAAETPLLTTNIDVGTFSKQGSSILIFAAGTVAANGNTKTVKLYFGNTEIFTTGGFTDSGISWTMQAEIIRNTPTSQIYWVQWFGSGATTPKIAVGTAPESFAIQQDVTLTGTGGATGDVTAQYWKGSLLT